MSLPDAPPLHQGVPRPTGFEVRGYIRSAFAIIHTIRVGEVISGQIYKFHPSIICGVMRG
ncbi:MAG: hypothetical protein METHAR1v1_480009 [Methanothrix sp.]|nr:MAG: hypothetical protein METHAR1v1_480009 [Methanothrix sp.]